MKGDDTLNNIEITGWVGIISVVLIIFCFYFTLTFVEYVHKGDDASSNNQNQQQSFVLD